MMELKLEVVKVTKPEEINIIIGQAHFIKTIEDLYEALVGAIPQIQCGIAFCEASGKMLVRSEGTDESLIGIARDNTLAIGCGHMFFIALKGAFPVNVLNQIKVVPEVCRVFCATANPVEVIVACTKQGRGIMGVIDGAPPKGIESEEDITWRKELLRKIGYKL